MMLQQSVMYKGETMSSIQHKKDNVGLNATKAEPTVKVSTEMAPRAEAVNPLQGENEGRKDDGSLAMVTPITNDSTVLLAQLDLTRAEIGSFRQLKTSTREKDYCVCIFEQQQEVEGEDEEEGKVSESLEFSALVGSGETMLHQTVRRSLRSSPTTTTSAALSVSATTSTTSCLSYLDSPPSSQGSSTAFTVSTKSPSSSPPRHHRRRSSTFSTTEEQQQQQQQQQQIRRRRFSSSRRPITAWLCLACGGPALELPQRWIKRISYTVSTRLLRISICDSAFSSYEGVSWRLSYKSEMKCEDPTNGELGRVRTIDLYLSRLVEPKVVNDLLARFPSDLISSSESPSALPSPLTYHHHHLHNSRPCGEGGGREVSCSLSTDCSPKMSPLGLLSPSLSEDTVWLSSSGGGTPDSLSQPYHLHPQQQVLTDATTDFLIQQQLQQQRLSNDAHDGDSKNRRDGLGRTVDDDSFLGSNNRNSTNSISNDASAPIMALLLMTHPKPLLPSPVVENYQLPHFTPCQQQLYQQQQQQSLQFFAQHSMCPQSNHPLGQDSTCNALIQGIATCRGRVTNSRLYQHRMSESDSGDLLAYGGGGFLSHGTEAQLAEQQQVYQGTRGKNQQGRRHSLQPQQQQNRQHYQHQQQRWYQQGGGNGNSGQRRKDQRRFSTSYEQKNSHHNHQHYYQQPLMSTSQDLHNVANSLSVTVQQASISLVSQPTAVSEAPLLQTPVSSRRRCISSGNFDPEPIAPIMPPSICSALRRRHARRMSCDGRLETYLTSLLESRSSQPASESTVAATVKVSVSSQSNSHRLQQQQQCSNQNQSQGVAGGHVQQNRGRSWTQGPSMLMEQTDAHYRSKRHSLTISTDFPKDSLWDTSMSSVSDAGYDRRSSIASSISDISISLSHSTTFSSSSSTTSLSSSSSNGVCTRKGGPPVHYTLMCWIGGRWPCRLRPLIKKSTLNDIHIMLRRNLKLPPNYYIDIEFEWQGQTYMIMDATHWQWAREQVQDGDMAIRCKIWQKRFAR